MYKNGYDKYGANIYCGATASVTIEGPPLTDISGAFFILQNIIKWKAPEWKKEADKNELKEEVMKLQTIPTVTDKMKLHLLIATRDHLDLFRMLQQHLQVDLDNTLTSPEDYNEELEDNDCDLPSILSSSEELNLLQISCWYGWYDLAKELLENHAVDVNAQVRKYSSDGCPRFGEEETYRDN